MSKLQGTIGNRGVQAIVQRYEGGEHAQFGARAGEVEKKFTVNGVEMTYGEVIAMGDLFKDRDGFRQCSKTELEALLTLIRRERDKGIGSVTEKDWIEAAGQRYVDLASKNEGHFAAAGSPSGFEAGDADNRARWFTYHEQALKLAQQKKVEEGLLTNAFGDHFLTDAFSAGHLINKKEVMDTAKKKLAGHEKAFERKVAAGILADSNGKRLEQYQANPGALSSWADMSAESLSDVIDRIRYWEGDTFFSTFAKAVHDQLNTDILPGGGGGIEVENNRGDRWPLAGDKTLSQSAETLRIAREAVAQSRRNVQEADGKREIETGKLAQLVWDYVPRPTAAGQKRVDEAKSSLTDPASDAAVTAWVKITINNLDAVLKVLKTKGLLRFKKNPHLKLGDDEKIIWMNAYGRPRLAVVEPADKRFTFKQWISAEAQPSVELMGKAQPGGIETVDPKEVTGHLPAPVEDLVVSMNAYGRWRLATVITGEQWRFKEWIPAGGETAAETRAAAQPGGLPRWDQAEIARHVSGPIPPPLPDAVQAPEPAPRH